MFGAVRSDEMNRIVRDHYPASQLPDDLKAAIGTARTVRLVIEADDGQASVSSTSFSAWAEELRLRSLRLKPATDDPVARIRKLRDEWDD
jgi:hypothetical protein